MTTRSSSNAAKERLHQIVDGITDEAAAALLDRLELELGEPEPLSDYEVDRTRRALNESRQGMGIPHEEVMRKFGVTD